MLEQLKKEVYEANMDLVAKGMVIYTWGNVSGIDREKGLVVIKPSGVDYATMTWEDMVVVDMEGNVVEGKYKPSSDTPTHLVIYKAFPETGGVVHTHSTYGVTFAQAGLDIPAWGRTPAGAVYNAVVLDKVAEMAYNTMTLNPRTKRVHQYLLDKHYFRKHGANAYYGQGSEDH